MTPLPKMYTQFSADPLISGAMGHTGESNNFIWFKTFLFVEAWVLPPFLKQDDYLTAHISGFSKFLSLSSA